jgi:penicillin-binding protein 1A
MGPRRPGRSRWTRGVVFVLLCAGLTVGASGALGLAGISAVYDVYSDRAHLPDPDPFTRFAFPTIGRIYDVNGEALIEFAREYRQLTRYDEIPPVVRQAILATEDRRFFSHDGVDYRSLARVVSKIRLGALAGRLATGGRRDNTPGPAIFPQGGSTITQQLVRGVFLQRETSQENSYQLRTAGLGAAALSGLVGARNANMALRKREETRLALWIEQEMLARFKSKTRAKEEIFARYASFVYMGNGQYGFASAARFYLGRPLSTLGADDADAAALLAGIMKSPRDYAPTARAGAPVLRRRNQILRLMAAQGFLTGPQLAAAERKPLPAGAPRLPPVLQSSAVVEHVLDELAIGDGLGVDALLQGQVHVYSTVDARVQRIASEALEGGLARYEERHPGARGLVQGSVVVLKNSDGSVLAEVGGRQLYSGRAPSYRDFNRVRESRRQPGSTMKPIVYLAAFRQGDFTLETLVPDEPISVPNGEVRKWIANYDGRFKGPIPIREALAESRNAVAVWITTRIGINAVLRAARSLGVETPLQPYITTALGASEMNLLELATAYRTIASGVVASPYVIRRVTRGAADSGRPDRERPAPVPVNDAALARIQEGLRGVVRLPTGTAHALAARAFPIAVMGKTGTTNDFRDALFVGSTYGVEGITVAVRIGFDDNRSLGRRETGGRVALPVFRDLMLKAYLGGLVGPVPRFPAAMEQRITRALESEPVPAPVTPSPSPAPSAFRTISSSR